MRLILLGLIALLSLLLTLLILMHKGKGGGLSDMFGAASPKTPAHPASPKRI